MIMDKWRFDKRIPIALLITLFLQISSALIWATQLNARVETLEDEQNGQLGFAEKLARIDERVKAVKQDVEYIKYMIEIVGRKYK